MSSNIKLWCDQCGTQVKVRTDNITQETRNAFEERLLEWSGLHVGHVRTAGAPPFDDAKPKQKTKNK